MTVTGIFCGKGVVNIQGCWKHTVVFWRFCVFLLNMTDGALTNVLKEEETIEWVWHNVSHAPNYSNRCTLYFWLVIDLVVEM